MSDPVYVSVDIEASGPIPGEYSLLAIGACLVSDPTVGFYQELKPVSDAFVPEAMAVCSLDLKELARTGLEPPEAMERFAEWLEERAGPKPVFTAYPVAFDWMFVAYYFHRFLGRNPFGISGADIRSVYLGRTGRDWVQTRKDRMIESVRPKSSLTHNALQDARDQALLFQRVLDLPHAEPGT
ncbi:MAG: 3'-5' exoribonuclease [Actinobacteria bacterium]|nr:3'-5' exoribonuclease [Actinomycetota bacterium]